MSEKAKVEIELRGNCADSRVVINGTDISNAVKSITVTQRAGEPPQVSIGLIGLLSLTKVQAATDVLVAAGALRFDSASSEMVQ